MHRRWSPDVCRQQLNNSGKQKGLHTSMNKTKGWIPDHSEGVFPRLDTGGWSHREKAGAMLGRKKSQLRYKIREQDG